MSGIYDEWIPVIKKVAAVFEYKYRAHKGEFLSYAYEGLVRALKSFDPSKGRTKKSYVEFCAEKEILEGIRREVGRKGNAKYAGRCGTSSIENEGRLPAAMIPAADDVIHMAEEKALALELIETLDPAKKRLIREYFYEEKTESDIAKRLGVTESRISQKKINILRQLGVFMAKKYDAEFKKKVLERAREIGTAAAAKEQKCSKATVFGWQKMEGKCTNKPKEIENKSTRKTPAVSGDEIDMLRAQVKALRGMLAQIIGFWDSAANP